MSKKKTLGGGGKCFLVKKKEGKNQWVVIQTGITGTLGSQINNLPGERWQVLGRQRGSEKRLYG